MMSTIKSEKAKAYISEQGIPWVYLSIVDRAVIIAETEAEERHRHETRWRSVEEELPETNNFGNGISAEVLCYVPGVHKVLSYSKNKFYPNGAWFNLSEELQQYPTHWKPIE